MLILKIHLHGTLELGLITNLTMDSKVLEVKGKLCPPRKKMFGFFYLTLA